MKDIQQLNNLIVILNVNSKIFIILNSEIEDFKDNFKIIEIESEILNKL